MKDMHTCLINVSEGGMLFEAAWIADILIACQPPEVGGFSQAILRSDDCHHPTHRVVHGQSRLNLLADHRLSDLDPDLKCGTILITGRGLTEEENA